MKAYGIGDIVTVTIDRPLGSCHPEHRELYYPINYGYIQGVAVPDGEEQDAYLLGVTRPVKAYTGEIIAKIHRFDDVEEKWVVVPAGMKVTKGEIERQVHFQEQYFQSVVRMAEESVCLSKRDGGSAPLVEGQARSDGDKKETEGEKGRKARLETGRDG